MGCNCLRCRAQPGPLVSPAQQTEWAWAVLVHKNAQRQGGTTDDEGADGKAQVEHLFLLHTAGPLHLHQQRVIDTMRVILWGEKRGMMCEKEEDHGSKWVG